MQRDFRADLHCHTTCSDGTLSPSEIIDLACQLGLQGLAITDHDTLEAYKTASSLSKEKELRLISGIEFSAQHNGQSVHILGYSFCLNSPAIQTFCDQHHQRRQKRGQSILEKLALHGMPLSIDEFSEELFSPTSHASVGRPHIAYAMMKRGYVKSIQQAFQEYIGEGKPCYVMNETFSVEETLDIIHQAKGLAVIAHPHLIKEVGVLKDLLSMEFDGIEGFYARFPRNAHERWIKIGEHRGWLITGGSDFHGEIKPNLPLGSSWVNEETFAVLEKHFHETNKGL